MTIQTTHAKSRYSYRISAANPRVIERRHNRHNARWVLWRMFTTAAQAQAAILKLGSGGGDAEEAVLA